MSEVLSALAGALLAGVISLIRDYLRSKDDQDRRRMEALNENERRQAEALNERQRRQADAFDEREQRRTEALRTASAAFAGKLARIELLAAAVVFDKAGRDEVLRQLPELQRQARSDFEVLRLVTRVKPTQEAAWAALRLSSQLWRAAERHAIHPRDSTSNLPAIQRELKAFLVGVRQELGILDAEDVFIEPADWQEFLNERQSAEISPGI